jgi:hypothetical protein
LFQIARDGKGIWGEGGKEIKIKKRRRTGAWKIQKHHYPLNFNRHFPLVITVITKSLSHHNHWCYNPLSATFLRRYCKLSLFMDVDFQFLSLTVLNRGRQPAACMWPSQPFHVARHMTWELANARRAKLFCH